MKLVIRTAHAEGQHGTLEITGEGEEDRAWLEKHKDEVMDRFAEACWPKRQRFISKTLLKDLAEEVEKLLKPSFAAKVTVSVERATLEQIGKLAG